MDRRALVAVGLAVVVAGCGGDDDGPSSERPPARAAERPALPFPPRANEPAAGPRVAGARGGGRLVRVGGRPEGVAVVDGVAGVGIKGERDELVLVEVASGRILRRVPVPSAPRHVGVTDDGRFLVPGEEADELALVPARGGGRVVRVPVGDNPHDAAGSASDDTAYTADEFGSTVSAVRGGEVIRSAPVDAQPGGVVVVGDQVAVVSVRAYTVELLDRRTLRGSGSQNVGYGPSHVVADAAGRLYVADTRGDGISVLSTRPRLRFEARVAVPGSPYGLALDARRKRLWVTRTGRNEVGLVDVAGRPRLVRSLPTIRQPNTVGVDEASGRLVVASATDGTVQLLDP